MIATRHHAQIFEGRCVGAQKIGELTATELMTAFRVDDVDDDDASIEQRATSRHDL